MTQNLISEPAREIPVVGEFDLCVLGGSCTGVFAAIRAARLGLSVAIVEKMGCFGGVATLSLVNVWHTPLDEVFEKRIFAGLTQEVIDRLKRRNSVKEDLANASVAWGFNSAEMQIELDELITENNITPWLHTSFVAPIVQDGQLTAIAIENKNGREAIKARFFIDATGDGDLCQRLGLDTYLAARRQPSTTCATFSEWDSLGNANWGALIREHADEYDLPDGFAWGGNIPGSDVFMLAGTRVFENCSTAEGFTKAEIEGRRQVRAIQDILRKYAPESKLALQALPARIGIRETRHVRCLHQLTGDEVLHGKRFDDAIANGSYRVDIHHDDKPGITFRYLDGREVYTRPGLPHENGRWREATAQSPTFYQIPYRSLVPQGPFGNVLAAGRFIDADTVAHGAIRVMVNMNQTGEAAGVAAYLALKNECPAREVSPAKLRTTLADGGSIIL
ncbi:FAD-dependent oxidoreductase [Cerasicoccus maritimus]|uniref:FAD-dependent oxidoreductase n=1 Tax=Cerasicoccus maritimus TaxID=490089 RepID=UPI002852AB73|nr:FAD-dependent oxidoreductase [Cerasicoccus maritimus]